MKYMEFTYVQNKQVIRSHLDIFICGDISFKLDTKPPATIN